MIPFDDKQAARLARVANRCNWYDAVALTIALTSDDWAKVHPLLTINVTRLTEIRDRAHKRRA